MSKPHTTIWLLCVNDFHAELEESENFPGCEKFVTAVQEFKRAHPNTFVFFGGDNYRGDPISEFLSGEPVSQMMRLLDTRASALGNHEFDFGMEMIERWQDEGHYQFISANLIDKRTGKVPAGIEASLLLECEERKILIVGLCMQEWLATADRPRQMENYEITSGLQAAKQVVKEAQTNPHIKPDAVVALTHYPLKYKHGTRQPEGDELIELCEGMPELNGVFTGHLHQLMALDVNGVAVAQGGSNSMGFSWLKLEFEENGNLLSVTPGYENLRLKQKMLTPDSEMHRLYQNTRNSAMVELGKVVAHLPKTILHRNLSTFEVDPEGTPLSDLATQMMCEMTGCDIALFYAGRIGRQLPAGDVTLYQLYQTLFFSNGIVVMDLPGKDIIRNVETGIRTLKKEGASPLAVRGLQIIADYAKPYQHRIESITLSNGDPLDTNKRYRIAVDDFLADSPLGFDFSSGTNLDYTGLYVRNGMIEYLQSGKMPNYDFEKTIILRHKET